MPEEPKMKTWRDLKRNTKQPVSWRARFRSFMKIFRRTLYIAALLAVAAVAYKAYDDGLIQRAMTPESESLKTINYRTDGRIKKDWLLRNNFFPPAINLAEIDILALKAKFESIAQVKSARIEKIYPDKLTIHLSERRPVARLALLRGENLEILCLASDGFFFTPIEYPQEDLEKLKWTTGVPLVVISGNLEPYARAEKLETFLLAASLKLPEYYKTWQIINVREMGSQTLPIIVVTTTDDVKIIFHAEDIAFELEKLEYVLRFCKETNLIDIEKDVEKIDLSLKTDAVLSPRKK